MPLIFDCRIVKKLQQPSADIFLLSNKCALYASGARLEDRNKKRRSKPGARNLEYNNDLDSVRVVHTFCKRYLDLYATAEVNIIKAKQ